MALTIWDIYVYYNTCILFYGIFHTGIYATAANPVTAGA